MKKYEFTRSIRFKLDGNISNFDNVEKIDDKKTEKKVYNDFIEAYQKLLWFFGKAVFNNFEDDELKKVKSKLEIKYKWIRIYARDEYNNFEIDKKSPKKYTIREMNFLDDVFKNWEKNNIDLLENIKDCFLREKDNEAKKSDMNFYIKQFLSHDYFSFVADFVNYANDKDESVGLNDLEKEIKEIDILAKIIQKNLAPNESNGFEVARASFNYYTINKTSKNFDQLLKEKEKKLKNSYDLSQNDRRILQEVGFLKKNKEKYYILSDVYNLSIDKLYDNLKDFKSQKKDDFIKSLTEESWRKNYQEENKQKNKQKIKKDINELKGRSFKGFGALADAVGIERKDDFKDSYIDDGKNVELFKKYILKNYPIFNADLGQIKKILDSTKQIKQLGIEKNQAKQNRQFNKMKSLDEKIRAIKIKRGNYFKFATKNYLEYCKFYKKIAMDRGKLKAEIKSLEQERVEARLLKYRSLLIENKENKNSKYQLVLIPKNVDNLANAKKYIQNIKNKEENKYLCVFNSLTLKALEKLMRKNGGKDIEKFNESEQEKIRFYKLVLENKYPKIKLDFAGFEKEIENISKKEYQTVEEFRLDLEKISYVINKIAISEKNIQELKEKFDVQIFNLNSYDLERQIMGKKEHTIIWEDFWKQENKEFNFPIRINPEVRIFFRNKKDKLPEKKQKNRFSKNQATVTFTITQNSAQEKMDLSFKDKDELIAITKQFNQDVIKPFIEEKGDKLYYYGIDRGNQELATLGVVQFSQEKYEVMLTNNEVKQFQNPIFPEIKTYQIKDECLQKKKDIVIDKKGNKKSINIINSPSYFIEDDVFEEKNSSFIDLTIAKLIKGKIVLNGDVKTYLNLKEANAKRKLFNIFTKINIDSNVEFNAKDNDFRINLKANERKNFERLCFFTKREEKYRSVENMQKILQEYLDDLRGDGKMETISINKINNLRDAITANMVGIIAFLFKKYPGIINLENLHNSKDNIQSHFNKNNENIARRLEWSLYRKFQKRSLVPPKLRQTIFLRENKKQKEKINQFGIIHFVKTGNTSANCPYCGESVSMSQRNKDKFEEHAYICRNNLNCNFTTKNPKSPLEKIKNSDDVAAYNIAKSNLRKD